MREGPLADLFRRTEDAAPAPEPAPLAHYSERLLDELEDAVGREHARAFAPLTKEQMRALIAHLAAVRGTL
jgi:hypothetical protein